MSIVNTSDGLKEPEPRRFLIATAVAHYPKNADWDRPGLEQARQDVIDLFTSQLGYRHQTALGLDPTKNQLTDHLRAFCTSPERRDDDLLAVYISGHGEVLEDGNEHVLLTSDTDPQDIAYTGLPTVDLARAILRGTRVRRVLLMLDACYSSKGGHEVAAAALTRIDNQWRTSAGQANSGLAIVSSAQANQMAQAGAFPRLLSQAVNSWATAGHGPHTLSLSTLVEHMNASPDRPGHQRIKLALVGLEGEPPPFLVNPRRDSALTGVDLAIQHAAEFEAQAERRDTELITRLMVRAMGSHNPDNPQLNSWWFSGRHRALEDITRWLRDAEAPEAVCRVVTAGPGSGKTAVLGLIAVLSHHEHRRTVPTSALGLPDHLVPDEGSVDVAVYAQRLTNEDVLSGLAAAAGFKAGSVGEFLEALQAQDRPRPFTALIDAIDEAATPETLCTQLLRPLITHAGGHIRLLLGTRPYLLDRLGFTPGNPARRASVIDLDDPRYADFRALKHYTVRNLLEAHPNSPYLHSPDALLPVAQAVAEAAGTSFLVARITASTLAAADTIPNPRDPQWRASLPRHAAAAMRNDLTRRLGDDAQRATDLLRPLAYAEGQGLPWEDIWAPLASAISGRHYTNEDLMWLRRTAGAYVVEATEADRSAYRLYHQSLVEYLRDDTVAPSIHAAFLDVFTRAVPYGADGRRDWSRAHPYTLRYLATHASDANRLDVLLQDTGYLVHAAPRSLTPLLHNARSEAARETSTIYRSCLPLLLESTPEQRRQVMATSAAAFKATDLMDHLNSEANRSGWTVRWAAGKGASPAIRDTLIGHAGPIQAVACTTLDNRPIAVTGSSDSTARLWDLTTGTQIGEPLTGHTRSISAVACTTLDNRPIAVTASSDSTARLWDLTTGTQIGEPLTGHTRSISAVACTTLNGRPIAVTGSGDSTVRLWDLTTGTQIGEPLTSHTYSINAVACTTLDNRRIAVTGSGDSTARLWDLTTGTQIGEPLTGHTNSINAVACTTLDNRPIAVTASGDSTARLWDLTTGTQIGEPLTGHTNSISAVACTTLNGRPIAVTASSDNTARLWDLTTGTQIGEPLTGHTSWINAVACTTLDNRPIAVTGSLDNSARLWDLSLNNAQSGPLTAHTRSISAVACTTLDNRPIAVTGSGDSTARLWDLTTGTQIGEPLTGHTRSISAVACTTLNGRPIAVTGSGDSTVRLWDLTTGTQIGEPLTGHTRSISAVACTTLNGRPIAVTGSGDSTVRLWDLTTGTQIGEPLTSHTYWISAVACTTLDNRRIAVTGSLDNSARLWDLTTGTQIGEPLTGHTNSIHAVACTTLNGRPIAVTASSDNTARLWDLTTGTQIGEPLTGHTNSIHAVACTTLDNRPIAVTGSDDNSVRLWDLTSARGHVAVKALAPTFAVCETDSSLVVANGTTLAVFEYGTTTKNRC